MSYSYGPTVIYPPAAFAMDQPFAFEASKENYLAMHSGVPSKVRHQPSLGPKQNLTFRTAI
jgi:hypothetical protein